MTDSNHLHVQNFCNAFSIFTQGVVTYTETVATNVFPQEILNYGALQEEFEVYNTYCSSFLLCCC